MEKKEEKEIKREEEKKERESAMRGIEDVENERWKSGQPRGILMTSVGCSKRHLTIKRGNESDAENSNILGARGGGGGDGLSIGTGFRSAWIYVEMPPAEGRPAGPSVEKRTTERQVQRAG